jgi:aminoglycoside 6-adenylyltransferase
LEKKVSSAPLTYDRLVNKFVHWANEEDNIRAAVVIGSRARTDHPADEWGDLDLCIFVNDPQPYLQNTAWLEQVGVSWLTFLEPTSDGRSWERRALFEGGLDVDFAFIPMAMAQGMSSQGVPPDVMDIFRRGYRILLDKDGLEGFLRQERAHSLAYQPPSQQDFLEVVNDFWYHTVWTTKHLRRGELWWAKSCCDGYLKYRLQVMLEWHAHARGGPDTDTWMRGRFLEEWADPRAVASLRQTFAHYDAEDTWRALLATMDLFRWLSLETAEKWSFAYPNFGAERAAELVQKMFAEKEVP